MVANLFRCALFLAAGAGWAATLHKRLRVEMEFVPALYCSGCVAVLFLAGLWNLLPEAVAVLLLAEVGYEELQGKQGAIVNLMGLRE